MLIMNTRRKARPWKGIVEWVRFQMDWELTDEEMDTIWEDEHGS